MLAQEALKRGDGLVFDSGAPDGDEEGGTVYNIQASRRHTSASGTFVELSFGPRQLNLYRIKVASAADPVQYQQLQDDVLRDMSEGLEIAWSCYEIEAHVVRAVVLAWGSLQEVNAQAATSQGRSFLICAI